MKVRATARGYYGGVIREIGDEFVLAKKEDLGSWMETEDKVLLKHLEDKPAPKPNVHAAAKGAADQKHKPGADQVM